MINVVSHIVCCLISAVIGAVMMCLLKGGDDK